MILTPKFVYIHLPKTGGTFVSSVLGRLMRRKGYWARVRNRLAGKQFINENQHGTCVEIPASHRHLPIVSCVRNPYDRFVSIYHFRKRKGGPDFVPKEPDGTGAARREATFADYIEAFTARYAGKDRAPLPGENRIGFQSEQFVRFFFRAPEAAWPLLDDAYIAGRRWEADMFPVRFLRMESLNRDLHRFLLDSGFDEEQVEFVLEEGKILPAGSNRTGDRPWSEFYTPELKARVRRHESLLFSIFPEYDAP